MNQFETALQEIIDNSDKQPPPPPPPVEEESLNNRDVNMFSAPFLVDKPSKQEVSIGLSNQQVDNEVKDESHQSNQIELF